MGARGKQSVASLAVVQPAGVTTVHRPEPQEGLTDEQASVWNSVVDRLPADWFPNETHDMLAQYCRHVISSRRVADLIESIFTVERAEDESEVEFLVRKLRWTEGYDRLLKMQEREGRAISALATRMRLSQQSTYSKDRGKGTLHKKPHEP